MGLGFRVRAPTNPKPLQPKTAIPTLKARPSNDSGQQHRMMIVTMTMIMTTSVSTTSILRMINAITVIHMAMGLAENKEITM